jgi:NADPH:quinone reductase-like Zn-dependent oxidoreductase
MRAAIYRTVGGPEVIEVVDLDLPEPGLDEVRIKVDASAMSLADVGAWSGVFPAPPAGSHYGIGWDIAGVIDARGDGGTPNLWNVGDPVIAVTQGAVGHARAHGEYAIVPTNALAPAPAGVDPVLASTIPLNGLTAAQSVELAAVGAGQTVVVAGAAGGVGSIAAKLAKLRGAHVIGIDQADNEDYVLGAAGADAFIAASDSPAIKARYADGVDTVINMTPQGPAMIAAIKDGGKFVTTRWDMMPPAERQISVRATLISPDAAMLTTLSDLAAAGELPLRVGATYPLEQASQAYAEFTTNPVRGRYVLKIR